MKKLLLVSLISAAFAINISAQHAFLGQGVIERLSDAGDNEMIPVMLMLEDKVDVYALNSDFKTQKTLVTERPKILMRKLKEKAADTQPAILSFLEDSDEPYSDVNQMWIANIIALKTTSALINDLANREDVAYIYLDEAAYSLDKPEKGSGMPKAEGAAEPGLEAIGAPALWEMGYTGHGRVAMTYDTGVWTDHPAISDRFLATRMPMQTTWFAYDSELPTDKPSSHGSHVTGIMLGLEEETNDTIGVAPRAYFIATDPIVSNLADIKPLSELMLGFQWAINPDGDEETTEDIPDVINNSWGRDNTNPAWELCPESVAEVFEAVNAAGIANIFSAGNDGPGDETIGIPHNINTTLINSFTVAAVNGSSSTFPVADFSSRGPSLCGGEGSLLIKPEVSAPGVNVRSSVAEGGYDFFSGTSMAAPHVSGAILLLKEAFPNVSGEELMLALYNSANDLGMPGEDNTYGMGMINVLDAYNLLSETYTPTPPQEFAEDIELVSIDSPQREIGCANIQEVSPVITVRNNGADPVSDITVSFDISGESFGTFTIEDEIEANTEIQVSLPAISYSGLGIKELYIRLSELDDEYDVFNNRMVSRWTELPEWDMGASGVFAENFSDGFDPNKWTILNPDGDIGWDTLEVLQIDGSIGFAAWMNHPDYSVIESQKDYLISPYISNYSGETQNLKFDLYYRKKGNNNFTQDTLAVYMSQVCEGSVEGIEIFRAGGEELFTNDDNDSDALPETVDEWLTRSFDIDLPVSEDPFYISFTTFNRRGNNLLIDNIQIGGPLRVTYAEVPEFSLFPNPNGGTFRIESAESIQDYLVFDQTGRMVKRGTLNAQNAQLSLDDLSKGVYLIQLNFSENQQATEKLVIQ